LPVRVYLNDPAELEELQASLRDAHCTSVAAGDGALDIAHLAALDEREESIELKFFLRAWQASRPWARVELEL
jgi:hypothetical protein